MNNGIETKNMKNNILFKLLILIFLNSCNDNKNKEKVNVLENTEQTRDSVFITNNCDSLINSEFYINERLPEWLLESNIINHLVVKKLYKIENRLNPLYLEDDFNGDGNLDVAIPIYEINTNKKGFAVIHGKTMEVFILGAGKIFKNALDDDQNYIDIWRVNHKKLNEPGIEEETGNEENGNLILKYPSIEIAKSEIGGGQIYWNGKEYAYFHQTC